MLPCPVFLSFSPFHPSLFYLVCLSHFPFCTFLHSPSSLSILPSFLSCFLPSSIFVPSFPSLLLSMFSFLDSFLFCFFLLSHLLPALFPVPSARPPSLSSGGVILCRGLVLLWLVNMSEEKTDSKRINRLTELQLPLCSVGHSFTQFHCFLSFLFRLSHLHSKLKRLEFRGKRWQVQIWPDTRSVNIKPGVDGQTDQKLTFNFKFCFFTT